MTKPVLLIRADGNQDDAQALTELGIDSVIDPYIRIDRAPDAADAQHLLAQISKPGNKWLIATSVNAIRCFEELVGPEALRAAIAASVDLRFAAVGERTAQALRQIGADEVLTPELSDSAALATMLAELGQSEPALGTPTAIIPSGLLAMKTLPNKLETAGWNLIQGVVYTTITVETEPETAAAARAGEFGAVIFRSPSAARAFLSFVPNPQMPLIAAGFTTAKVIQDAGLAVASIPSNPTPKSVAAAVSEILKGDR
jgi:uroporphyrinogen-III synthase